MSITELKSEIDRLTPEQLQHIKTYLAVRQDLLDPEFRREMTRKIEDKNLEKWVTLEEAEKRLFPV